MSDGTHPEGPPAALRVLGSLELDGPTGAITLRPGRERKLLLLLLINRDAAVPVDVIVEELWPQQRPANERNALQVLVSGLRRQLEPVAGDFTIERTADAYGLIVRDPASIDTVAFDRALRRAQDHLDGERTQAALVRALDAFDRALGMWRGIPYTEALYDGFAQAEITRLREAHANGREQRARALLELGRSGEAVEALQALATDHPLRESVWAALILALYRSQRQGEALRLYSVARQHLVDELGVEPGPELKDLEQRVLLQDPSLDWTPPLADALTDASAARERAGQAAAALRLEDNIPAELSSLVGRRDEISGVRDMFDQHRLVTLTGPGGIGKTRVALAVAGELRSRVVARVVDLGAVQDGADVGLVIASELGIQTQPGVDAADSIAAALGNVELLLVLDTCEHVLNSAALMVSRLLRRAGGLRILATSRQPLGVSGEFVWTLATLGPDDAVHLFVERARARRTGFALDDTNAADITRICAALDGLPLAIELAAARVNLLSPAGILERLGDRFALLAQGGSDVDARQRSLRATIEWSYELLTPQQQRFFDRLSAFASSFDLDAASHVAGAGLDEDPLDLLAALVDRSLVQSAPGDRFDLLDTLRSFGEERLRDAADERDATRRRHAEWYFGVATTADPWSHGPLPEGWANLRVEAANCLAALDWFTESGRADRAARLAGSLAGYWMIDGQILRAHHELDSRRGTEADDASLASLWRGIGVLEMYRSRYDESVAAATRSVAYARRTEQPLLVASTLLTLGSSQWGAGDFDASMRNLEEAAQLFDADGDHRGKGFALARLGRSYAGVDDPRAIDTLVEGGRLLQEAGDRWMRCVALEHLAAALLRHGALAPALVAAEQAVEVGRVAGSHTGVLFAQCTLGRVLLAAGRVDDGTRIALSSLEMATEMANPGGIADAIDLGAVAARSSGALALAATLLGCADRVRASHAVTEPTGPHAAREAIVAALRATLGADAVDEHRRSGAAMTPAWALEHIRELTATV